MNGQPQGPLSLDVPGDWLALDGGLWVFVPTAATGAQIDAALQIVWRVAAQRLLSPPQEAGQGR